MLQFLAIFKQNADRRVETTQDLQQSKYLHYLYDFHCIIWLLKLSEIAQSIFFQIKVIPLYLIITINADWFCLLPVL